MTRNKWMTKIYLAFTKYKLSVYLFGYTNQCDPVEKPSKIHYDYFKSVTIKEMFPERIEMKYIEGIKSRYDTQTRDLLTKFLTTGTISHQFQPKKLSYHITCYFNETRRGVTEACCNRFTKDKYYHEIKFNYQGKTEQYKVAVGMHFLATKHGGSLCKFRK